MLRLLGLLGPYVVWLYPIGVVALLIYLRAWLVASRDLRASLFTLERDTALSRMHRAATGAFAVFGLLVALFLLQFYLGRTVDISELIRPTPTPEFMVHVDFDLTPTPTPTMPTDVDLTSAPTPTRRATPHPITLVPTVDTTPAEPTNTVSAPPAQCGNPGVQLLQPGQGARVRGSVDVRGTANIQNFQFYKIEMGLGEHPSGWSVIGDIHRNPVTSGHLETWETAALPAGTYTLRLVVVDASGNFPPPCEVHVTVAH